MRGTNIDKYPLTKKGISAFSRFTSKSDPFKTRFRPATSARLAKKRVGTSSHEATNVTTALKCVCQSTNQQAAETNRREPPSEGEAIGQQDSKQNAEALQVCFWRTFAWRWPVEVEVANLKVSRFCACRAKCELFCSKKSAANLPNHPKTNLPAIFEGGFDFRLLHPDFPPGFPVVIPSQNELYAVSTSRG